MLLYLSCLACGCRYGGKYRKIFIIVIEYFLFLIRFGDSHILYCNSGILGIIAISGYDPYLIICTNQSSQPDCLTANYFISCFIC